MTAFTHADTHKLTISAYSLSFSLYVRVSSVIFNGIVALSKTPLTVRQQRQTKSSTDRERVLTSHTALSLSLSLSHTHTQTQQAEYEIILAAVSLLDPFPLRNKRVGLRAEKPDLSKSLLGGQGLASRCCKNWVTLHSHVQNQSLPSREVVSLWVCCTEHVIYILRFLTELLHCTPIALFVSRVQNSIVFCLFF